jgi:hypothetical protein
MNDVERRLRDLGETAQNDVTAGLRPRPEALRRIGRRRTALTAGALACAAAVFAAGAFAWSGTAEDPPVRPADDQRTPSVEARACEPTAVVARFAPPGFSKRLEMPRVTTGRGVLGVFRGPGRAAIEVTLSHYAYPQRRPLPVDVLGGRGTLGAIRGGYSVVLDDVSCGLAFNGYEVTKAELERFAEGLRQPKGLTFMHDEYHEGTIWPPDDFGPDAAQQCTVDMHERDDPVAVAKDFLRVELGWEDAIVVEPKRWWEPWYATRSAPDAYETPPGIELRMSETVAPNCWSVDAAGTFAGGLDPEGLEVSVRGSRVTVSFPPREGTLQVIADVRYGPLRPPVRHSVGSGEDGRGRVDLDFVPTEPGRLLLHFQGSDKGAFYAIGVPLLPGDYDHP